uniref:Secreted protein n=1 Tax=Kryptolebias marmoratus TaxID=37003 RepID=A0A3Q3AIY4_KRYMA
MPQYLFFRLLCFLVCVWVPYLTCSVSGRFVENYCLPLCDIFSPAVAVICDVPLFAPPAALSLRSAFRNKYGIKCQMHREFKNHKKTPVIINFLSQSVVNMQPPPVMMIPANPPPVGVVTQTGIMHASY